jgi:hypothetical protein
VKKKNKGKFPESYIFELNKNEKRAGSGNFLPP